jgi:hypothetical protein
MVVIKNATYISRCPFSKTLIKQTNRICLFNKVQFDAFKNNKVFAFTNKKGETGGVLYYELAPNRPDLVLKDIIKIILTQFSHVYH